MEYILKPLSEKQNHAYLTLINEKEYYEYLSARWKVYHNGQQATPTQLLRKLKMSAGLYTSLNLEELLLTVLHTIEYYFIDDDEKLHSLFKAILLDDEYKSAFEEKESEIKYLISDLTPDIARYPSALAETLDYFNVVNTIWERRHGVEPTALLWRLVKEARELTPKEIHPSLPLIVIHSISYVFSNEWAEIEEYFNPVSKTNKILRDAIFMGHCEDTPTLKKHKEEVKKLNQEVKRIVKNVDYFVNPKPEEKETPMKELKLETITYINGEDVNSISDQALISRISNIETQIQELERVKTPSRRIKEHIDLLNSNIKTLVGILDGRCEKKPVRKPTKKAPVKE